MPNGYGLGPTLKGDPTALAKRPRPSPRSTDHCCPRFAGDYIQVAIFADINKREAVRVRITPDTRDNRRIGRCCEGLVLVTRRMSTS